MERARIEEFLVEGKNFIYIDMSDFKTGGEFTELIKRAEPLIAKYPEGSLYTITNLENSKFDTEMKGFVLDYLQHNKPYIKYGAVIGFDGIKKIMLNVLLEQSGRDNLLFAFSREQAVEFLLEK